MIKKITAIVVVFIFTQQAFAEFTTTQMTMCFTQAVARVLPNDYRIVQQSIDLSEKSVYHKLLKNTLFLDFGYDERDVVFDVTSPRGLLRGQATLVVELDRSSYSAEMKETNSELSKIFETDPRFKTQGNNSSVLMTELYTMRKFRCSVVVSPNDPPKAQEPIQLRDFHFERISIANQRVQ